jgi:hypothetical protein
MRRQSQLSIDGENLGLGVTGTTFLDIECNQTLCTFV